MPAPNNSVDSEARLSLTTAVGEPLKDMFKRGPWSKPALLAGVCMAMVFAVTGCVMAIWALTKPQVVEHHVSVSNTENSTHIGGQLTCQNTADITGNVVITGSETTDKTTVTANLKTQTLTVADIPLTNSFLQTVSTFREFVQVGRSEAYTWSLTEAGTFMWPASSLFTVNEPWTLLDGNTLWYVTPPFVNDTQKTAAFVDLTPGIWTLVFQGRFTVNGSANASNYVRPFLVAYTKDMENVVENGASNSSSALLATYAPDPDDTANNALMFAWTTVQIPNTSAFFDTSALRPMVEFQITTDKSNAEISLFDLTLTCIKN